jgi:lipoprotein-releasing system permease protein
MNYEFFIAKRYLTAKRKQAFISVITFISVLGITIGVMALIIAIALITGFQNDVQDKILSATSHLMVQSMSEEGLKDYVKVMARIKDVPGVRSVSPIAHNQALITGSAQTGAYLKGIDFDLEVKQSAWLQKLESGVVPGPASASGRDGLLLGHDLAFKLGVGVGDVVTVLTSAMRLTPTGLAPKQKTFLVTGIFVTGLYEFDSATALIPLPIAQKLFGLKDSVSYLQVMIDDIFAASRMKDLFRSVLPPLAYTTTWMELNKSLFSALKLEKNIIFLTIMLIVFVAALNIIATLILMVMEKTRDIGILIAMGATSLNIRRIFFYQGALIGAVGTALGTLLGLVWCALANAFQLIKVPVDIYQISYVPFHIKVIDLLMIVGVSLLISLLSTLFPSHRASKTDPVVALKYE